MASALCTVCLFTPQLSLVLIVSTHGGMARLSWPRSVDVCVFDIYKMCEFCNRVICIINITLQLDSVSTPPIQCFLSIGTACVTNFYDIIIL